jgi:presenilin-like A22 family membrane protease
MKHSLKIISLLIGIFLLAQFVGLLIVNRYVDVQKTTETGQTVYKNLPYSIERPEMEQSTSFIFIIVGVIIGTLLILLIIKIKKMLLWKLWFFLAVSITLAIAFSAFINPFLAALISVILTIFKVFRPNVIIHNLTEIFIYGGLAAVFVPLMNFIAVLILLILISIYDMIAVWKIKHMITLAEFQTESKVFAGISIPKKEEKAKISAKPAKIKKSEAKTGITSAILGGGDIAFPLLFAGVVMKQYGFALSLIIPIIAAIVLFILLVKGERGKFYPAMPFLTAGCLVGFFIIRLIGML